MKFVYIIVIRYILVYGFANDWTFISELQEVCPYTSFCEFDANTTVPPDYETDLRPCCMPCSCSSDCMDSRNCCHFDSDDNVTTPRQECVSSVTSARGKGTHESHMYYMVRSCPSDGYGFMECLQNETGFEPVYSPSDKQIYVNLYCAKCNHINDGIKWRRALKCHQLSRVDTLGDVALAALQGQAVIDEFCFTSYIAPQGYDLKLLTCRDNVIRQCNVTGNAMQWKPYWNYCPLFNATYTAHTHVAFGNIFCYMCNVGNTAQVPSLCLKEEVKSKNTVDLTLVLDYIPLETVSGMVTDNTSNGQCPPNQAFVQSFNTSECRQLECPWGQFRLDQECDFYSNDWIGHRVSVILKLTPIDPVNKFPTSIFTGMTPEVRFDERAKWLERRAMKRWKIKSLYSPTNDQGFVNHLVVIATYRGTSVNPERLKKTIETTLKETWTMSNHSLTIRFKVSMNPRKDYIRIDSFKMAKVGIYIDGDVAYTLGSYMFDDLYERLSIEYLLPVSKISGEDFRNIINLSKLFLCQQIVLRQDEYKETRHSEILFTVTNKTLYGNEFRVSVNDEYHVCLEQFPMLNQSTHPSVEVWWIYSFILVVAYQCTLHL